MTRWLIGLICVALGVAGLLVTNSRISEDECFRYDLGVKDAYICGTPDEIKAQMRRDGKQAAETADRVYNDPKTLCKVRAIVQRDMHRWPNEYYQAYVEGCESATFDHAVDSNMSPAWQHKRDVKEALCTAKEGGCK